MNSSLKSQLLSFTSLLVTYIFLIFLIVLNSSFTVFFIIFISDYLSPYSTSDLDYFYSLLQSVHLLVIHIDFIILFAAYHLSSFLIIRVLPSYLSPSSQFSIEFAKMNLLQLVFWLLVAWLTYPSVSLISGF